MNNIDKKVLEYLSRAEDVLATYAGYPGRKDLFNSRSDIKMIIELAKVIQTEEFENEKGWQ